MSGNDEEISTIKKLHNKYFELLSDNNMDELANLFSYPSAFKGFLNKIDIASDKKDLKRVYEELISAAPQSDLDANITISTDLKNSIPYKLRDDSYVIVMEYSQYREDKSELFTGRACYLFTKLDGDWKISGVF
tara:strand:- start:1282 stop:1683 length:402 start_codon:yes stop_codon:yes gene_type:complete